MRSSLLAMIALAACSREPVIDLPVCAGALQLDASAKHSMTIDARGHVTVDGVGCSNEREIGAAFGSMAMDIDPIATELSGRTFFGDALALRIDGATHFEDAARLLRTASDNLIYRKWIVVRDKAAGSEGCLQLERLPPPAQGSIPFNPDWKPGSDRVLLVLHASDNSWWSDGAHPSPDWRVLRWQKPQIHNVSSATSWAEIRDMIVSIPAEDRDFVIEAALPRDTPWREVVPIVAEALQLMHAEVEIP